MGKITRRKLVKLFTGSLFGSVFVRKVISKDKVEKESGVYNVIDDMIEEMKGKFDIKYPGKEFQYHIHCSYTGLAVLNDTGQLEKGKFESSLRGHKFRHSFILWMPLGSQGELYRVIVMRAAGDWGGGRDNDMYLQRYYDNIGFEILEKNERIDFSNPGLCFKPEQYRSGYLMKNRKSFLPILRCSIVERCCAVNRSEEGKALWKNHYGTYQ